MFKFVFLSLLLTAEVFAKIEFYPCAHSPFEPTRNVVVYTGKDYDDYKNGGGKFIFYVENSKEGLSEAPAKLQLGYMYGELFAAGGLGYFDSKKHKIYQQVLELRKQRKFENLFDIVRPHINKKKIAEKQEVNDRWNQYRGKGISNINQKLDSFLIHTIKVRNRNILGYMDTDNNCYGILKLSEDPSVGIDRERKGSYENLKINFLAHRLNLSQYLSETTILTHSFVSPQHTKKGDLQPFYSLNSPAGFDDTAAVTLTVGKSKAGNVIPQLYPEVETFKKNVDIISLNHAVLLAYILGIPDLNDDNFITEWNPYIQKFTTRLVSFQTANTLTNQELATSRKPGQGLHKFLNYMLVNYGLGEDFIKQIESWGPLVCAYDIYLETQTKFSVADEVLERISTIKNVVKRYRDQNQNIGWRNLITDILKSEEEAYGFKGNWSEVFNTSVGQILHTPGFTNFGFMRSQTISLECKMLNGIPLKAPLNLSTNSTRAEFVAALKAAGIYNGS